MSDNTERFTDWGPDTLVSAPMPSKADLATIAEGSVVVGYLDRLGRPTRAADNPKFARMREPSGREVVLPVHK